MLTFLPAGFEQYIAPQTDRLEFLREYLLKRGVCSSVIKIAERKHLYVNFPSSAYDFSFKTKTVISHYDRVKGSPGANDNSAANFALADFSVRLNKISLQGARHNTRVFFTDGEESREGGVFSQGAFALASLFKKLKITNDDVFVFDACGRGTVPILAKAGLESAEHMTKSAAKNAILFRKRFASLFERALKILNEVSSESAVLPVPYSDNAGFLACGIPAVAITFLPKDEAALYTKNLIDDKNLGKAVMNARLSDTEARNCKEKMPVTWQLFHTECDTPQSLTAESFSLIAAILDKIAAARFKTDLQKTF